MLATHTRHRLRDLLRRRAATSRLVRRALADALNAGAADAGARGGAGASAGAQSLSTSAAAAAGAAASSSGAAAGQTRVFGSGSRAATELHAALSKAHPAVCQALRTLSTRVRMQQALPVQTVPRAAVTSAAAAAGAGTKLSASSSASRTALPRAFHSAAATRNASATSNTATDAKDTKTPAAPNTAAGAATGAAAADSAKTAAGASAAAMAAAAADAAATATGATAAGADAKAGDEQQQQQQAPPEEEQQQEPAPEEAYTDTSHYWKRLSYVALFGVAVAAFVYQNFGNVGERSLFLSYCAWAANFKVGDDYPLRHRAFLSFIQMHLSQTNDLGRLGIAKNQNFIESIIKLALGKLDATNEAEREPMRNAAAILAEVTKVDEATLEILRYHPQLHTDLLQLAVSDDKELCVFASTIVSQIAAIDEDQRQAFITAGAADTLLRACRAANAEVSGMAALALATVLSDFDDLTQQRALLKTTNDREREIEVFAAFTRAGETILSAGGNTNLAIKYLKQALTLDPTNFLVLSFLGFEHFKLDQLDEAQKYFEKSLQSMPDFAESAYGLAKLRFRKALMSDGSDNRKALEDLESAASLLSTTLAGTFVKPGDSVTSQYLLLVRILESLDKEDEAVRRAREWVDKTSFDPLAHFTLGRLLLRRGRLTDAMDCFVQAKQLDTTKPEVLYYMALTQWRLHNFDDALQSVNSALYLIREEDKRKALIRQSEEVKRREAEEMMLPPGVPRPPPQTVAPPRERSHNDKMHFLKGKILAAKDDFKGAADAFSEYVRLRKDEPEGHYQWAQMLEKSGDVAQSYQVYGAAVRAWKAQCRESGSCKQYFKANAAEAAALARIADLCGPATAGAVERHRDLQALSQEVQELQDMP